MLFFILSLELIFLCSNSIAKQIKIVYAIEEQSNPQLIGNLFQDSKMKTSLKLQLHSVRPENHNFLRIDPENGNLYTTMTFNREVICPTPTFATCQIISTVQFASGIWIEIAVEIKDINDNFPRFSKDNYRYSISENVEPGYLISLESAHDYDVGKNAELSYKFSGNISLFFSLLPFPNSPPQLRVEKKLDYEIEAMRQTILILEACDKGEERKCGSTQIEILLVDVNDNPPVFNRDKYDLFVNETVRIHSTIAIITAKDLDSGANGQIRYSLSKSPESFPNNYFMINSNGELKTMNSLENLNLETFEIIIIAEDFGTPSLKAFCKVKIIVVDVNNHRPEILVKGDKHLEVLENKPENTHIGMIFVFDRDKNENGFIKCSLKGSQDSVRMYLENRLSHTNFYALNTTRMLDRETDAVLLIQIFCSDNGTPSLTSQSNFTIRVLDENEYPPKFANSNFEIAINEDIEISTNIFQLIGTDHDATANLSYRFVTDSSHFQLNSKTGWIKTKAVFDRETEDTFKLNCVVIDNTSSQIFSSTTILTVYIQDCNDNAPILQSPKSFQIMENTINQKTHLGTLMAIDKDLGENGTIRFALSKVIGFNAKQDEELVPNNMFEIDPVSGHVYVKNVLDREEISKYLITVKLYDLGKLPMSTEDVFEISVADRNDNKPQWEVMLNELNVTLPCLDTTPVFHLKAIDLDSEKNANLTFSLLSRSEYFRLHSVTGQLYPSRSIKEGTYELTFQACDNGHPPLYSDILRVSIRVWPQPSYGMTNEEKEKIDSVIIIIIASATCIVFLCLLSAIVIVRWQKDPRLSRSEDIKTSTDAIDITALNKWTDHQNQYTLSIANQYYRPTSIISDDANKDVYNNGNEEMYPCDNTACSMFHFRYPLTQEIEMSSGDSGKGTIDEDNLNIDLKAKSLTTNRHYIPMVNSFQSPVLSKISSTFIPGNLSPKMNSLKLQTSLVSIDCGSREQSHSAYNNNSSSTVPQNSIVYLN